MADLDRANTVNTSAGDLEIGVSDAIQRHYSRHVVQRRPITQKRLDFERRRPRWLRECAAEALGVFFYVYPGIASVANFITNSNDPTTAPIIGAFSSFFQIGLAFAIGIAFAIIVCFSTQDVCAPTSGGHFNPAVTLCLAFWQGFPWRKVPYFILSQIFGSFMAALMVMGQYHVQITAVSDAYAAKGLSPVSSTGPAGIFMALPNPNQTNLGYLFLVEFFVDSFIALVIWACLDPANPFVSPSTVPFAIGLVYGIMVWGFADITISTNLARDLGCRSVAAIFYGREVFTYYHYSWIGILVNVPATFFGTGVYELFLRDSLQKIGKGGALHEDGDEGLRKHLTNNGMIMENGMTAGTEKMNGSDY